MRYRVSGIAHDSDKDGAGKIMTAALAVSFLKSLSVGIEG